MQDKNSITRLPYIMETHENSISDWNLCKDVVTMIPPAWWRRCVFSCDRSHWWGVIMFVNAPFCDVFISKRWFPRHHRAAPQQPRRRACLVGSTRYAIMTHIIVFGDLNAASKLSPVLNVRLNCLGTSAPVIERSFSVTVITTGAVTSALKILTAADEIIPQWHELNFNAI